MSESPIEVTTRYATSVNDLSDAWAFVMAHLDDVGADPSIEIKPVWSRSFDAAADDAPWPRHFTVVVSGMTAHAKATTGAAS